MIIKRYYVYDNWHILVSNIYVIYLIHNYLWLDIILYLCFRWNLPLSRLWWCSCHSGFDRDLWASVVPCQQQEKHHIDNDEMRWKRVGKTTSWWLGGEYPVHGSTLKKVHVVSPGVSGVFHVCGRLLVWHNGSWNTSRWHFYNILAFFFTARANPYFFLNSFPKIALFSSAYSNMMLGRHLFLLSEVFVGWSFSRVTLLGWKWSGTYFGRRKCDAFTVFSELICCWCLSDIFTAIVECIINPFPGLLSQDVPGWV